MIRWLRDLLGGRREREVSSRVRSRVDLPTYHEIPSCVLRSIRLVHPDMDAWARPDGVVWLLKYEPGKPRIHEGRKALINARAEGFLGEEPMFMERLMAQGFAMYSEEPFHFGMAASYMQARASRIHSVTETQVKEAMKVRRAYADSSAQALERANVIRERIRANARSDWGHAFRNRKWFGYKQSLSR